MPSKESFKIISNEKIADNVFLMHLFGNTSALKAPGQFINILIPGKYLRRPISVCEWNSNSLKIIYKVVGQGTYLMSKMNRGTKLDSLIGLGNGFDLSSSGKRPLVVGGGVGIPPLYELTKKLVLSGAKPYVILGFNKKSEIFYESEFKALNASVCVTTSDGSYGVKGFVTDALPSEYSYFYACGPLPMFKALNKAVKTSGEYSFEQRMACGFGACMGCSIMTENGPKRICKDGPVLKREEVIW